MRRVSPFQLSLYLIRTMQTYEIKKKPSYLKSCVPGFRSKISSICNGIGMVLALALSSFAQADDNKLDPSLDFAPSVENDGKSETPNSDPSLNFTAVLEGANAFNLPSGQNVPRYLLNILNATLGYEKYGLSISHLALSNPDLLSLYHHAFIIEFFVKELGFVDKLSVAYDDFFEVFRASIDYKNFQLTGLHALEGFQNIKLSGSFPIWNGFEVSGSAMLVSRTQGKDVVGSVNLGYVLPLGKNFNIGTSLGLILNGENPDTLKRESAQPLALVFVGFQH